MTGTVECPRCGRATDADGIWLWVGGQAHRLQVIAGRIQQSGHVDVFDLACGCKFNTDLWSLAVSTSVSASRGQSVTIRVTPMPVISASELREQFARTVLHHRDAPDLVDHLMADVNARAWGSDG